MGASVNYAIPYPEQGDRVDVAKHLKDAVVASDAAIKSVVYVLPADLSVTTLAATGAVTAGSVTATGLVKGANVQATGGVTAAGLTITVGGTIQTLTVNANLACATFQASGQATLGTVVQDGALGFFGHAPQAQYGGAQCQTAINNLPAGDTKTALQHLLNAMRNVGLMS